MAERAEWFWWWLGKFQRVVGAFRYDDTPELRNTPGLAVVSARAAIVGRRGPC